MVNGGQAGGCSGFADASWRLMVLIAGDGQWWQWLVNIWRLHILIAWWRMLVDAGYAYRGLMRINYDHKWQIVVYKCYTGGKNWQYPAKIMQHGNCKTKKHFLNRQHQQ